MASKTRSQQQQQQQKKDKAPEFDARWLQLPEKQQELRELNTAIFSLDTLVDFELQNLKSDSKLYVQRNKVLFLHRPPAGGPTAVESLLQEKRLERDALKAKFAALEAEVTGLEAAFFRFKRFAAEHDL